MFQHREESNDGFSEDQASLSGSRGYEDSENSRSSNETNSSSEESSSGDEQDSADDDGESIWSHIFRYAREQSSDRESYSFSEFKNMVVEGFAHWCNIISAFKHDPTYKSILKTKRRLQDEDEMDNDEALQYAIRKRQCLIRRQISQEDMLESSDENDDDSADV